MGMLLFAAYWIDAQIAVCRMAMPFFFRCFLLRANQIFFFNGFKALFIVLVIFVFFQSANLIFHYTNLITFFPVRMSWLRFTLFLSAQWIFGVVAFIGMLMLLFFAIKGRLVVFQGHSR
ncbi:hypothetical protein [uncultured Dubosiella sp.]|uniref:hypothetical protein n=1 Tax=uncultured Dubosiella sp. TaxID=1937011 RepID=UPI00259A6C10|nr:hypothetical protein [uncultured Dubosiella sp.]